MAATLVSTIKRFTGKTADMAATTGPAGSTFFDEDTGLLYTMSGSGAWAVKTTQLASGAAVTLSGSSLTIGAKTYAVSGGDTIRGKSADKPAAAAAHAAIPYSFYFSIDTGAVEATDGANWTVI